jgi:hypothetical protein
MMQVHMFDVIVIHELYIVVYVGVFFEMLYLHIAYDRKKCRWYASNW